MSNPTIVVGGGILALYLWWRKANSKPDNEKCAVQVCKRREPRNRVFKLKQVQVLFRHGARIPLKHLAGVPNSIPYAYYDSTILDRNIGHGDIPYIVTDLEGNERPESTLDKIYRRVIFKGGTSAGTLTGYGKDMAYVLGNKLRDRYIDDLKFLGPLYNSSEVYIRSTNVSRCIQSLQCLIAGMYGKKSFIGDDAQAYKMRKKNEGCANMSEAQRKQLESMHLSEKLIIPVAEVAGERLYPNVKMCTFLYAHEKKMLEKLRDDPEEDFLELKKKVNEILGLADDQIVYNISLRDHVVSRLTHGIPVPEKLFNLTDDIIKKAVEEFAMLFVGDIETDPLLKITAGPVLDMITNNMELAVSEPDEAKKMYIYSCHDSTILPVLWALGCFEGEWSPYCADLKIEFYEDANAELFVKVFYLDKEKVLCNQKEALVSFETFKEIVGKYRTGDGAWTGLCGAGVSEAYEHAASTGSAVMNPKDEEAEEPEDFIYEPDIIPPVIPHPCEGKRKSIDPIVIPKDDTSFNAESCKLDPKKY